MHNFINSQVQYIFITSISHVKYFIVTFLSESAEYQKRDIKGRQLQRFDCPLLQVVKRSWIPGQWLPFNNGCNGRLQGTSIGVFKYVIWYKRDKKSSSQVKNLLNNICIFFFIDIAVNLRFYLQFKRTIIHKKRQKIGNSIIEKI